MTNIVISLLIFALFYLGMNITNLGKKPKLVISLISTLLITKIPINWDLKVGIFIVLFIIWFVSWSLIKGSKIGK